MSQKNIGNRKALKSQKKIRLALIDLMKKEDYNDITISQLSKEAGLSRRTFYRNYSTKEDIINEYYMEIWQEYTEEVKKLEDFSLHNIALLFFSKMQEYSELLALFNKNNLFTLFLNHASKLMTQDYPKRSSRISQLDPKNITYITLFVSGGFFQMAKTWFDRGQKETPEELAQYVKNISLIY